MMLGRAAVGVMARVPRMGAGKTRLARGIGRVAAVRVQRVLLARAWRAASGGAWHARLFVAPDSARAVVGLGGGVGLGEGVVLGQGLGDLGARMARALVALGRLGLPVGLMGADLPSVRASVVAQALRLLAAADVVLGPAPDGGFWFIGLRNPYRAHGLFAAVRWSSPHAMGDVLANAGRARVAFAPTLADMDTADDYARHSLRPRR